MSRYSLICEDAIKWADHYEGDPFHSLLCDSPYHLTSITKRFGKLGSKPAKEGKDGRYTRLSRGFLNQQWDGGDLAFRPETWLSFGRILLPGAFCMAFGGSRGWHRMAVAIEDAGFIIHPTIFLWAYGEGLPKATSVKDDRWEDYYYGGQALKPAVEPIIVFQKPYDRAPRSVITETGAGALNIGGARLPVDPNVDDSRLGGRGDWSTDKAGYGGFPTGGRVKSHPNGRWPTNFILNEETARRINRQSGHRKSGLMKAGTITTTNGGYMGGMLGREIKNDTYADSEGAARYFFSYQEDQLDEIDPAFYCPKPSRSEREAGLENFPSVTVGDGRPTPIDNPYQRGKTERKAIHPTYKPVQLNQHLATILLPPDFYTPRRLFVPFAGVASEMIGALRAGWDDVVGVEIGDKYVEQGLARLKHWIKPSDPDQSTDPGDQLALF